MRPPRLWRPWWRLSAPWRDLAECVALFAAVEVAWVGMVAGLFVLLEAALPPLRSVLG